MCKFDFHVEVWLGSFQVLMFVSDYETVSESAQVAIHFYDKGGKWEW